MEFVAGRSGPRTRHRRRHAPGARPARRPLALAVGLAEPVQQQRRPGPRRTPSSTERMPFV